MQQDHKNNLLLVRSTTQESVVDRLRTLILNRHFRPGERLPQTQLAQELGVSRTPIREALHQLAAEGLVAISAYKGASVAEFSISDLREIYSVRIALEGYAAFLAAQIITEEQLQALESLLGKMQAALNAEDYQTLLALNRKFHTGIYAAAKQDRLYDMIINYLDMAEIYRRIFVSLNNRRDELVKHQDVVTAMRNRDANLAEQLTRSHLLETANALADFLESSQVDASAKGYA
jgi:DNA-binding GntR family transcriptional regulator